VAEFKPSSRSFVWGLSAAAYNFREYGNMNAKSVAVDPGSGLVLVGGTSEYCAKVWNHNDNVVPTGLTELCSRNRRSGWVAGIDPDGGTGPSGNPWGRWTFRQALQTEAGYTCTDCPVTYPPDVAARPGGGFIAVARVESYLRSPVGMYFDYSVSNRPAESIVMAVTLDKTSPTGGAVSWLDYVESPATNDTASGVAAGVDGIYLA
jgi:hypothetical protein